MSNPYLGEIRIFGGNFAPQGWAFCDGSLLSISTNAALFSILGTTYGGNGQTTFALPDLRGRTPLHPGQGSGLSNYNLGETGGVETATLTPAKIPAHGHGLQGRSGPATSHSPAGSVPAQPSAGAVYKSGGSTVTMDPASISATPSGPHTNMAPFIAMNFIIALQGLFPSPN